MNFGHSSENFEKSSEIFGKCSEMFGKLLNILDVVVCIINRILHVRAWIRILSSSVQLDISRVGTARYRVEHSKIKFVSTRGHEISSIYSLPRSLKFQELAYYFS